MATVLKARGYRTGAFVGAFVLDARFGLNRGFDEYDDRVDTLTRGFLGLTVACARCHDHKFDPISTRDYYALAGVFASTVAAPRPLADVDPRAETRCRSSRARSATETFTAGAPTASHPIRPQSWL